MLDSRDMNAKIEQKIRVIRCSLLPFGASELRSGSIGFAGVFPQFAPGSVGFADASPLFVPLKDQKMLQKIH